MTSSTAEIIGLYQVIIENQAANHSTFVYALTAMFLVVGAATWWWNKQGAKSFIKLQVENAKVEIQEAALEKIEMRVNNATESHLEEHTNRIKAIEANLCKSIAIQASSSQRHDYAISWFAKSLIICIELQQGRPTRATLDQILAELRKIESLDNYSVLLSEEEVSSIASIVEKVPETLDKEKEEIKRLLDSIF